MRVTETVRDGSHEPTDPLSTDSIHASVRSGSRCNRQTAEESTRMGLTSLPQPGTQSLGGAHQDLQNARREKPSLVVTWINDVEDVKIH